MVQRKFMVIKKLQRALTDKNKDEEGFFRACIAKVSNAEGFDDTESKVF